LNYKWRQRGAALAKRIEKRSGHFLDTKRKQVRRGSMVAMDRCIHELEARVAERSLVARQFEVELAVRAQRKQELESELFEQRQRLNRAQERFDQSLAERGVDLAQARQVKGELETRVTCLQSISALRRTGGENLRLRVADLDQSVIVNKSAFQPDSNE
jgi:hypothetical protein